MSVRVSLRGMLRLIRVDTLRRAHSACLLVERLIDRFHCPEMLTFDLFAITVVSQYFGTENTSNYHCVF